MKELDIEKLTPDQLSQLEQQIAAKKAAAKARLLAERANYKDIVNKTVHDQIIELMQISNMLSLAKANVYGSFTAIIELKTELYGVNSGQQSHTFSDEEGNSITIGWRVIDRFDDTLDMGIACVRDYISGLSVDEKTAKLVDMLNNLLKKDAKGNLKPNRILDLQNMADEINNPVLYKGVEIIRSSYKPMRSVVFIEADRIDTSGKKEGIPLSITSVDFPQGFEPNFNVFK